jgi:hypothetical protein
MRHLWETYVTMSGISALIASSIPAAATGGLYLCQKLSCMRSMEAARYEDGRCGRASGSLRFLYTREDGLAEVLSAGLFWVRAADDICAWESASMARSRVNRIGGRRGAYRTRSLVGRGSCQNISATSSSPSLIALTIPAVL